MDWQELCEKAQEMGYKPVKRYFNVPEFIENNITDVFFTPYGTVGVYYNDKGGRQVIAADKTPAQMLAIMEALR